MSNAIGLLTGRFQCNYDLTALKDSRVRDQVLPFDVRNLTDTAKMQLIELCDEPTIRCPGLTATQQGIVSTTAL